jgi:hypothetical protein
MHQENLWATAARLTGFAMSFRIDALDPEERGLFTSCLTYSKDPAAGNGFCIVRLEKDEHELIPDLAGLVLARWEYPGANQTIPRALKNCHGAYENYHQNKGPRSEF